MMMSMNSIKRKDHALLMAGMEQVVKHGTAEVMIENEHGSLIHDTFSDAWMIDCDSHETGKQWMDRFIPDECHLFQSLRGDLAEEAKNRWGFSEILICHQAVFEKEEVPALTGSLHIQSAEEKDLSFILENYHQLDESEIRILIGIHHIFIGYDTDGNRTGIAGIHMEGSAGLLEILPEYRRHGYGMELEKYVLQYMKQNDMIPFCQVETDNDKSLALQEKIGMSISKGNVYWLFG